MIKSALTKLTVAQLKELAKKHNLKVQGSVEEDWVEIRTFAPTKSQYVNKLVTVVSEKELVSLSKLPVTSNKETEPVERRTRTDSIF